MTTDNAPPLDGITVLDLTRVLAGPWCTQTLADLGAEVWKIEPPEQGDDTRGWAPPEVGGESTYFLCCNRGKKSVALDLKSEEGRVAALALAKRADVLVENFRRGTLERFGLGYEDLAALNPRLIYCSISGYGRTGPRADEPGYDFTVQAESGLMSATGEPDGQPMRYGVAISDLATGMNATQAILAAIIARTRTGRGQHLDIALFDSALALTANLSSGYLAAGDAPRRYGNAHPTVVPYQVFATADGSVVLACGNDGQFKNLCEKVLDLPEMPGDERYRTNRARVLNRDTLIPALQTVFATRPTLDWIDRLKTAGVPGGQVRNIGQACDAPEVAERGLIVEAEDAKHGRLRFVRSPLRFSETPTVDPVAPPRLGEHTAEALALIAETEEP